MEQGKAISNSSSTLLPLLATAFTSLLLLAGCGSNPPAPTQDMARADSGKRAASTPAPARSGRGAYYLDDGPADVIPPGLENTPDAEPKLEALLPRANRPYVVFGKTYTPIAESEPYKKRGIGSWYGRRYHGQKTSSGEPYDMFAMTAAHPTLPIPSYARVTDLATGRQVIVRINDRGPFLSERIIDLSYTAALKLGYMNHGSGELEVEKLMPDEIERLAALRKGAQSAPAMAENAPAATSPVPTPATVVTLVEDKVKATPGGWYLQLGAFSQQTNAEQARLKVIANWPDLEVEQAKGLYRLYAGPFASRAQAEAAASAAPAGSSTPIIVQK